MSWLNARTAAAGVIGIGAVVTFFPRTTGKVMPNAFETPAVKSVGDRHSIGGASNTHTTGVATPRGHADKTASPALNPTGVDTAHFQEKHNAQKIGEGGGPSAAFHKAHYGENNSKGK